jgi:2'-hydroxyisoflavone reductase
VALARGHQVSVFNRGKTEKRIPFEFSGVERLYGNRDPNLPADDTRGGDGALLTPDASPKGLEQLVDKKWDVVIDNSGYYPAHVKASAELLAPNCGGYIFISSISAYADNKVVGADEDHPLAKLADPNVTDMGPNFANYGGLKALCEQAAQAAFPDRCAVVRPGYIVGPGDPTDRFTYWPVRIARGGDVLAPGAPGDPLQWIDVRDLAEWLVKLAEDGTTGVFNAIGPDQPARWGAVLEECRAQSKTPTTLTWIDGDFIEEGGVRRRGRPVPDLDRAEGRLPRLPPLGGATSARRGPASSSAPPPTRSRRPPRGIRPRSSGACASPTRCSPTRRRRDCAGAEGRRSHALRQGRRRRRRRRS